MMLSQVRFDARERGWEGWWCVGGRVGGRGSESQCPFFSLILFGLLCLPARRRRRESGSAFFFFCWFHLPIYSAILIYLLGDAGESENARVYDPSHESLKRSLKETHGVHMTYTIDTWCTHRVRTRESTILRTRVWRLLWKKFWKVSALLYLLYKRSL